MSDGDPVAVAPQTEVYATNPAPVLLMPPHLRHQRNGSMLRIDAKMPELPLY